MNRRQTAVLGVTLVLVSACGVSTEDTPQIIDTNSSPPAPTTSQPPSPSSTAPTSSSVTPSR